MTLARQHVQLLAVLPPRVLLLDLAGPIEVLRVANDLQDRVAFEVRYAAPKSATRCSIGLDLGGTGPVPDDIEDGTLVFLPGSAGRGLAPWPDVESNEGAEGAIIAWLRETVRPSHTLIMVCEGSLLAARAGLLDGYACTTHHASCAKLAAATPRARVLEDRLFVEDRNRLSSAGVTAGVDLMLYLVARWCGPAVAVAVARTLVVYLRRGPNDPQLSPWLEGRNHLHPAVHRAQDVIAADPARDWSLAELGRASGASARNLSRLFMTHTGMTVTAAINRARMILVYDLLAWTGLNMEQVAERAGFGSARHMRRIWHQYHPHSPSSFREAAASEVA